MTKIGPFFYINNKLIYNACELSEGRRQADKLDNSYGHEALSLIVKIVVSKSRFFLCSFRLADVTPHLS